MATKSILLNFVNIRTYIEHTIGDQKRQVKLWLHVILISPSNFNLKIYHTKNNNFSILTSWRRTDSVINRYIIWISHHWHRCCHTWRNSGCSSSCGCCAAISRWCWYFREIMRTLWCFDLRHINGFRSQFWIFFR